MIFVSSILIFCVRYRFPSTELYYYHIVFPSDIDECSKAELNRCQHKCRNIDGSFKCFCNIGYRLDKDKINCNGKRIFSGQKLLLCFGNLQLMEYFFFSLCLFVFRWYTISFVNLYISFFGFIQFYKIWFAQI